jgi:hypothetical protein
VLIQLKDNTINTIDRIYLTIYIISFKNN